MAYDKVIDSAALDAGMTATANAIREKTGQAGAIPWENDKGFAAAVAGIQVGGGLGGHSYEITIGANSITNAFDANAYIFGLVREPAYVILKSYPDTNNQMVGFGPSASSNMLRYRNGGFGSAVNQTAYDAKLIEGTVYVVFEYGA